MAHIHNVYDSDHHFLINHLTRAVENKEPQKTTLIQYDHNSERFTFEIPRFIDGHDMSTCNVVEVHYLNIEAKTSTQNAGLYIVEDLQVSPDDENVVILSWLISQNATKLIGTLNFLICFKCVTEGNIDYAWNTAICSSIAISTGICNSEVIVEQNADILAEWEIRITALERGIENVGFNVKDFGAVGDGNTDDTEAFRICLASAKGQTVIVPKGIYAVNYCVVEGAVSLKGIDNPTIIRTQAPTNTLNQCIFKFNNCYNAEISGITFDCKRDNFLTEAIPSYSVEGSAIQTTETYQEWMNTACVYFFEGGKNINIHDCTFLNCSREGVYCKGDFENIHIHNNIFQNTSANFWGAYGDFKNVVFENNITDNCRTMVVEFDQITNGVEHLVVRNNKMTNIAKSGVSVPKGSDFVIEGNYYTPKTTLDEYGRSSSDLPVPYLVWLLYAGGDANVIKNVVIKDNSGTASRMLSVYSGSTVQENSIYNNFTVKNNNFICNEMGIRASYLEDLKIENNVLNAPTSSNVHSGISLKYCKNISIKNTEINNVKNALYLESCKGIDLYYNILNSTVNPVYLDSDSMKSSNTETQLSVVGNTADWGKVNQIEFARATPFNKVGNNVNLSSSLLKVPYSDKASSGNYRIYVSSVVDTILLDGTNMVANDNGEIPVFAITTKEMIGRTIRLIITGKPVKLITDGGTTNIKNAITVPVDGILDLTFNGSRWVATTDGVDKSYVDNLFSTYDTSILEILGGDANVE